LLPARRGCPGAALPAFAWATPDRRNEHYPSIRPMGKKRKQGKEKLNRAGLASAIMDLFARSSGQAYNIKQITRKLGLKKKADIKQATLVVQELASRHKLRQLANG